MLRLYEREGLIRPPQRSDAGDRHDARLARLALLRSDLAPLAAGDFRALDADADCRFLMDFLAAAPATVEATA